MREKKKDQNKESEFSQISVYYFWCEVKGNIDIKGLNEATIWVKGLKVKQWWFMGGKLSRFWERWKNRKMTTERNEFFSRIPLNRMTCSYEGSSMIICNLCLYPPQVKDRDREKKGMKNRRDADRGWNTWAGEKSKCTEHSAAREWLNDPILGSLLDTRQRCMKIDTQVLDSVRCIIKRIDIILQQRMKTK